MFECARNLMTERDRESHFIMKVTNVEDLFRSLGIHTVSDTRELLVWFLVLW